MGEPGIVTLEERMACNHEYKEQLGAENYSMLIVVIYNYLIMKSRPGNCPRVTPTIIATLLVAI